MIKIVEASTKARIAASGRMQLPSESDEVFRRRDAVKGDDQSVMAGPRRDRGKCVQCLDWQGLWRIDPAPSVHLIVKG
jgi:hypothetical protein